MTRDREQPEPARPADPVGPAWMRYASQVSADEYVELLPARQKAANATPRIQAALTIVPIVAVALAVLGFVIFNWSEFRAMDIQYGVDEEGNFIGGAVDYKVAAVVLAAVVGALLVIAGARFDVQARARTWLMTAGAAVMVVVGSVTGLQLDPSRDDLQAHYHVGEWGSEEQFGLLVGALSAVGWAVFVCGAVCLVLAYVQRRRVAAAYPEGS